MADDAPDLAGQYARLHLLYQVSKDIHSTLDPQAALALILDGAVRLTGATSGSVVLINPTTQLLEVHASVGLPGGVRDLRLRLGEGITGWVARTGRTARVGEVSADPRYFHLDPAVRSELAVPLEVRGEVRGVLNVDSTRAEAFSAIDESQLQELAREAARVIGNTWLHEQVRLKARSFESLISVGQAINSSLNLDDALAIITHESAGLMGAKVGSLLLLDDSRQWLDLRACWGAGDAYRNKPRLSVADSLVGSVVRRRKPVQVPDVRHSGRYQNIDIARSEGLVALLSVPLLFNGQPLGVLSVYLGEPHVFSDDQVHLLGTLAELSALAIEKARLYERIVGMEEQLRQTEKLTALGLLAAEVAHEIRNPLTVIKLLFHSLDLRYPPGDPRSEDVRLMGEKMDHLNRIVEQILDFARRTEPHLAPVDVNQLITDLGLLTRHKLRQHGVELIPRLGRLPLWRADATQLEQAFLNLMLNAVEAMPHGGRFVIATRTLHLRGRRAPASHLLVRFSDNGEGMAPEMQARAFDSLLTTTKRRGTGLGLAIVRRVVEAHRGEVRVRSGRGRGTAIRLLFPLAGPEHS